MFNYEAIAKVIKNGRRGGMFGTVLKVPAAIAEYFGFKFILLYGNACYYCKSESEVHDECAKHNWGVLLYENAGNQ